MAPVGIYPTGAIALYGDGVRRLIARALSLRVAYGRWSQRSVADKLGIQPPAVSRAACGAQAFLLLAVRTFAFCALRS